MKKTTKILSVILSVLTLLSMFSVANPIFAAEIQETETKENISTENPASSTETKIISEIEERRTENVKHFLMSDGSYRAITYNDTVHYYENNKWKDIDNELVYNEDNETYENKENSFKATFSEDLDSDELFSIENDGYNLSWAYQGNYFKQKFIKAEKQEAEDFENEFSEYAQNINSKIIYEEFENDSDLEYVVTPTGVKENIILNKQTGKNKFKFDVTAEDLSLVLNEDGSISALNGNGEEKFYIPAPFMYDSKGEYCYDVSYELNERNNGKYFVTINADKNWLKDENTVYPVTIDPQVQTRQEKSAITSTFVTSGEPNTNYRGRQDLYIGYESSQYLKCRSLFKMVLPELNSGDMVVGASLCALMDDSNFYTTTMPEQEIQAHLITENWDVDTVKWSNHPEYDSVVLDYDYITREQYDWKYFDITKAVKGWYEGTFANYGILIRKSIESGNLGEVCARGVFWSDNANNATNAYPVIAIEYRNHKGLESYWSYSSYSNGNAGAAYVNDYTGNLVYELPILSSISEIAPLTLTAYYNTYTAGVKYSAGKNGSAKTTLGKGLRLNVQETILPSSKYGLTGDSATTYPYVWTDGDGTEHYIKKETKDGKTTYKDEDGLGITLIVGGSDDSYKYRLHDENRNRWYFNNQGNLYVIRDANDNDIRITYKSAVDGHEANTLIDYITDGAGHKFTFDYYKSESKINGYIKTITDNAGRVITFNTSSGRLNSIKYYDNTVTSIAYTGDGSEGLFDYVQDFEGFGLNFDHSSKTTGRRIVRVIEIRKEGTSNVSGQRVTFDRTSYNTTVIRSAGIDGIHNEQNSSNGPDDIVTTLQFDNWGRTTSQQVKLGSGSAIGAGKYNHTSGKSTLASANKVSSSATLGKNTENLATNIGAERSGSWSFAKTETGTTTGSFSTEDKNIGAKSFKIAVTNVTKTGDGGYYYQDVSGLSGGSTYTFSADVKVKSLSNYIQNTIGGASLAIRALGTEDNGAVFSPDKLIATTDSSINKGWRRISVSLKLPDDATGVRMYLEFRSAEGIAYFDNIQLEKGSVSTECNLLENASFEKVSSNAPALWGNAGDFTIAVNSNGTVTDGSTTVTYKSGSKSIRVTGEPDESKGVAQTVPVYGSANDTYILSGWAAGYPINATNHSSLKFELAARVNYTCTDNSTGETSTVSQYKDAAIFNTTITGWQHSSTAFPLKYKSPESGKTYTPVSITVVPRYNKGENHVYFDHLQLIKDVASSYTYDSEGNVVSVSANAEQKSNMTYDGKDLKTYKDAAGYTSTYTYDDKHNLETAKTPRGVKSAYEYNANGNVTVTEQSNSSGSMVIKTEQTYHGANADKGIKAGAYQRYSYDANGYGTKTEFSWERGIATKVIDANGTQTVYGYNDAQQNRLTSITTDNSKVTYGYTKVGNVLTNRQNEITFSDASNSAVSEKYSFVYDKFGNVEKTLVGSQALSTNEYDSTGAFLKKTTYGNGSVKSYVYNKLGLVSSITKNGATFSWEYESDGTTKTHSDSKNDIKQYYTYDSIGRHIRTETRKKSTNTHLGFTEYAFDSRNNLTKLIFNRGGRTFADTYYYSKNDNIANSESYAKDNLISRYKITSSRFQNYTYDSLDRLTLVEITTGNPIYINYIYQLSARNAENQDTYRTTQIKREIIKDTAYQYTYDVLGNITAIQKGTRINAGTSDIDTTGYSAYRSYEYDNKSQLERVNNASENKTRTYEYDALGNILTKTEYSYTSSETAVSNPIKTISYNYGKDNKTGWNNLLVGVDLDGDGVYNENGSESITYDAIGNPTTYLGATLTWYGRELQSYSDGINSISYSYDVDGLRTGKTVNGITSEYYYEGGLLRYEKRGDVELYFRYNDKGHLAAIQHYDSQGTANNYYVTTNFQGDVIGLYSGSGTLLTSYEYDEWGNATITNPSGLAIAELNPIRYRGYYYDSETGFYYLQSRYYNPEIGRFINADGVNDSDAKVLGFNLYIYCGNNPINNTDPTGEGLLNTLASWARKVKNKVNTLREKWKNKNRTVSGGLNLNAGAGGAQCLVSADAKGNVSIQPSLSVNIGIGSSSLSAGSYISTTNAPNVNKLTGFGYQIGGVVISPALIGGSAEAVFAPDFENDTTYSGAGGGVLCGIPGISFGISFSYTFDAYTFNAFDFIEEKCDEVISWDE